MIVSSRVIPKAFGIVSGDSLPRYLGEMSSFNWNVRDGVVWTFIPPLKGVAPNDGAGGCGFPETIFWFR